ncbi:MAG: hypothetical protein GF411_02675 [Candidatus Lokiarchaeota archaeon]|nr:hypothetical protein [Candidatus Lokiarchaeota archaeon]
MQKQNDPYDEKNIEQAFRAYLLHREANASLDEILSWHQLQDKFFSDFLQTYQNHQG